MKLLLAMALALALTSIGCTADPLMPPAPRLSVQPDCQLGCVETDPYPDSAGIYLGTGASASDCFNAVQNDVDHDGLGDYCELRLALAFDPQMVYSFGDNVGREPKWAARVLSNQEWWYGIGLFYAQSYYVDLGTEDALCGGFWGTECAGHAGDSEYAIESLTFNPNTQHWLLSELILSQHGNDVFYEAGDEGYVAGITYPGNIGGAPQIWSSSGKHANYISAKLCDRGGYAHLDECTGPYTYVQLGVTGNGDLGSSSHHLIDCIASENPLYSSNPAECYWTNTYFAGWQTWNPVAAGYRWPLLNQGY